MTPSPSEQRYCEHCGEAFTHEPMMVGKIDLLASVKLCGPCSDQAELEEIKAKRTAKAKAAWEEQVPATYRATDPEHPDYPNNLHAEAFSWMASNIIKPGDEVLPFLGIMGASGLGKTRVISQMVRKLIWLRHHVTWMNSSSFQWAAQHQFNSKESAEAVKHLHAWKRTEILVFDDIGSLKSTEVISDALYGLLEHRSANAMPILWTSNEDLEEIMAGKGITDKARRRIITRLGGFSEIIATATPQTS